MLTVETIGDKLVPYCASRREVLLAYLFGSVAQGRTNRLSDIDIALLVDEEEFEKLDAQEPYGYKAAAIADLMGLTSYKRGRSRPAPRGHAPVGQRGD